MAKKDLVVNIDSKTRGLEQGVSKSVNEVRRLENQTRKSKNEFRQFDDRVGKLVSGNLGGLLGTMGSVAGVIATAKLAQEGFNRTMRASQESSDDFDRAIMGVKGGVDAFFQSLNTGDWSNFFQNIGTAISKSRELYDGLDRLSDMRYAEDYLSAEEGAKIAEYRAKLRDKSTTDEERKKIKVDAQEILDEQLARALRKGEQAQKNKILSFQLATKMPNATEEDIKLLNTIFSGYHEDEMESAIWLRNERKKVEDRLGGRYGVGESGINYSRDEDEKYLERIKTRQKNLEEIVPGITTAANAQKLYMESGMDKVNALQKEQHGAVKAYWDAQGSLNRLLGIGSTTGAGATTSTIYDVGSMAYSDDEIKKREDAVNRAIIGSEEHKQAEIALAEAINYKNNLILQTAKSINIEDIELGDAKKIKQKLVDILATTTNKEMKEEIENLLNYYNKEIEQIEFKLEKEIKLNLQVGQPITSGYKYSGDTESIGELLSEVRKMRRESVYKGGSIDFKEIEKALKDSEAVTNRKSVLYGLPTEGTGTDKYKENIDLSNRKDLDQYKSNITKQIDIFTKLMLNEQDLEIVTHYNNQIIKLKEELLNIEKIDLASLFKDFEFDKDKILDPNYINNEIEKLVNKKQTISNDINNISKELLREDNDIINKVEAGNVIMELGFEVQDIDAILEKLYEYKKINDEISEGKWLKEAEGAKILTESLYGVGSALNTIASISNNTTANVLGGFAQMLGGIAEMIPAIKTLTLLKNQEALSSAVASGAAVPFPLNLVAISSGIASVIAGISTSIPKFAEGGLVYGNTLAQVGEYSGVSNNPEVIAPLSKLRDILSDTQQNGVGGDVKFRIEGKDLMGVLNTHNQINRRR